MKKLLIPLMILVAPVVYAQRGIAPGAGLVTGPETGINGRVYYFPNERICFGPEVNLFPREDHDLKEDLELSFNGHYIFEIHEKLGFYPLAGLNWKYEEKFRFRGNVGAGLHGAFGRIAPYAEYIYSLGFENEGIFLIGTFLTFDFGGGEGKAGE